MAYADFVYYTDVYHGTSIGENEWPMLSERASDYVDYITQGRAEQNSALPQVKKTVCALAENFQIIEKAKSAAISDNGELASQTVGSFSATYRSSAETAQQYQRQLYNVAAQRLSNTGLLSRGRGCHTCTFHTL